MNILVVEDESLAQQRIEQILSHRLPKINILATAQSIAEFSEILESDIQLDLILCDIHLADGLSFKALQGREINIPIIFITAYDEYALDSFDHLCLDYILKPVEEERLVKAFQKYFSLEKRSKEPLLSSEIVDHLLNKYNPKAYKRRFLTKIGKRFKFVPVEEIAYFYVKDGITYLVEAATSQKFIVDHNLNELQENLLDPLKFYRINRSSIIHLDSLLELKPYKNGRLSLSLNGTRIAEDLVVAREKVSDFKNWINQ